METSKSEADVCMDISDQVCRVGVKSLFPFFFFVSFLSICRFCFRVFLSCYFASSFWWFSSFSPFIDVFISSISLFLQFSLVF